MIQNSYIIPHTKLQIILSTKEICWRRCHMHCRASSSLSHIRIEIASDTALLMKKETCSGCKVGVKTGEPDPLNLYAERQPWLVWDKFLWFALGLRGSTMPSIGSWYGGQYTTNSLVRTSLNTIFNVYSYHIALIQFPYQSHTFVFGSILLHSAKWYGEVWLK